MRSRTLWWSDGQWHRSDSGPATRRRPPAALRPPTRLPARSPRPSAKSTFQRLWRERSGCRPRPRPRPRRPAAAAPAAARQRLWEECWAAWQQLVSPQRGSRLACLAGRLLGGGCRRRYCVAGPVCLHLTPPPTSPPLPAALLTGALLWWRRRRAAAAAASAAGGATGPKGAGKPGDQWGPTDADPKGLSDLESGGAGGKWAPGSPGSPTIGAVAVRGLPPGSPASLAPAGGGALDAFTPASPPLSPPASTYLGSGSTTAAGAAPGLAPVTPNVGTAAELELAAAAEVAGVARARRSACGGVGGCMSSAEDSLANLCGCKASPPPPWPVETHLVPPGNGCSRPSAARQQLATPGPAPHCPPLTRRPPPLPCSARAQLTEQQRRRPPKPASQQQGPSLFIPAGLSHSGEAAAARRRGRASAARGGRGRLPRLARAPGVAERAGLGHPVFRPRDFAEHRGGLVWARLRGRVVRACLCLLGYDMER